MTDDILRSLGYSTLGSRLKRLGEKLQAQTQEISDQVAGTALPASHNPILAALDQHGPLSIGALAGTLGQSQPGVTRMVNKLKSAGLVDSRPDQRDKRVSQVVLTPKGDALAAHLRQTLWPRSLQTVADACAGLEGSLLDQLSQLEDALEARPLVGRCADAPLPGWPPAFPGTLSQDP